MMLVLRNTAQITGCKQQCEATILPPPQYARWYHLVFWWAVGEREEMLLSFKNLERDSPDTGNTIARFMHDPG